MTISVGVKSHNAAATGSTLVTPGVTTQNNGKSTFLVGVAFYQGFGAGLASITDSKGNTYTQVGGDGIQANPGVRSRLYKCEGGIGGAGHTATYTDNLSTLVAGMIFMELIGSAAAPTLDQSSQGVTGSPFLSGSTPNTTVANEMLVGFCGASDPWADPTTYAESGATPSGTWTFQDQINSGTNGTIGYYCAMATSPIAAIGSYQWSFTEFSASAAASHIATFYEPGGGGPSSDLLMGQACL